jgi:hypothetical protein
MAKFIRVGKGIQKLDTRLVKKLVVTASRGETGNVDQDIPADIYIYTVKEKLCTLVQWEGF